MKPQPKLSQSGASVNSQHKQDALKESAMKALMMPEISLGILAAKLECSPEDVEYIYKEQVRQDIYNSGRSFDSMGARVRLLLEATEANQYREAREATQLFGVTVKPEDTGSGMMYKWIREVVDDTPPI